MNLMATRRDDAPPVFSYTRGCKRTAIAIARDPAKLAEAVSQLEDRVYNHKTKGPREHRRALWEEILAECGHPPAPFTSEAFRDGTAVLLAAGYRSASIIAEQALLTHIEHGGKLTDLLRRQRSMFRRACARGRGPPKRVDAWPLELSAKLPAGHAPLVQGGPLHPRRLFVCCCWWLVREIEAGNATAGDVTALDHSTAWALPASKTDISALGTARVHGCACGQLTPTAAAIPLELCPACSLREQARWVTEQFAGRPDIPLWPTETGAFCTKKAVVETIVAAARLLGLRTTTPAGAAAWGGHAFRRGGAQYLAQQGIDVWRIQALARHSSTAILAYLEESNLASLKGLSTDAALGRSIESVRAELAVLTAEARSSRFQSMSICAPQATTAAQTAVFTSQDEVILPETPEVAGSHEYVVNTLPAGKVHIINPRCSHMTYCRWAWRDSKHHIVAKSPQGFRPCIKCEAHRTAEGAQAAASSDSSPASSESEP